MGRIRELSNGLEQQLDARVVVGRGGGADLRISDARVSAEHACIAWGRGGWTIRDLGSRNGTYVNGERLDPGQAVALSTGLRIAFADAGILFEWTSSAPPPVQARCGDGRILAAIDGLLCIPSPNDPQTCVFWSDGRWRIEDAQGYRPAPARFELNQQVWHLELPELLLTTVQQAPRLCDVDLQLAVSLDEEYVATRVEMCGQTHTLPFRAHHYMLVVLARCRASTDDGWVQTDELARMLAMDRGALNVQIYRARQEFAALNILDAARLIERDAGSVLRLGPVQATVSRLQSV